MSVTALATTFDAALASHWVDLLLVVLAGEGLALVWWARRHAVPPGLPWHLAAGAGLALALRSALEPTATGELALWLAVAGGCHVVALWRIARHARQRVVGEPVACERASAPRA